MVIELNDGTTLAPCPLCGSEPKLKADGWFNPKTGQNEDAYYWVKCQNKYCGISPAATNTQGAAVSAWNSRA